MRAPVDGNGDEEGHGRGWTIYWDASSWSNRGQRHRNGIESERIHFWLHTYMTSMACECIVDLIEWMLLPLIRFCFFRQRELRHFRFIFQRDFMFALVMLVALSRHFLPRFAYFIISFWWKPLSCFTHFSVDIVSLRQWKVKVFSLVRGNVAIPRLTSTEHTHHEQQRRANGNKNSKYWKYEEEEAEENMLYGWWNADE